MVNILQLIIRSVLLSQFALCSKFIKWSLSNMSDRLDMGCLKYVGVMSHDILDCARECLLEDKCQGFCMDDGLKCYIHFHCKLLADSSDEVTYFQRLAAPEDCLNAGTWHPESQTCKCSGGAVGLRCERFAESCRELFQHGYLVGRRQPFIIHPPGLNLFLAFCLLYDGEIRTDVFFHTASGLLSYNRSFADFVKEFYYNNSEYWIGLENMYGPNTLERLSKIRLFIKFSGSGSIQFQFNGVVIGNASSNYFFNYSEVTYKKSGLPENLELVSNCLPESGRPTPFSAYDADNDAEQTENCAKNSGAGWWFSTCDPDPVCNPLGVPITPGTVNITREHMMFRGLDLKTLASQFEYVRMYFFEAIN